MNWIYKCPYCKNWGSIEWKNIDNTFNDVIIDNTQLPAGTYFYNLQTKKGMVLVQRG